MKVDGGLPTDLREVPARIRELEDAGFAAAMTAETAHDPFFPLLLAAEHSERIELMTSIAVAFARTPMNLANVGHDLNAYSQGRLILGLGSQIRPHITKRFSMPWSHPARRMREFILAMRAIWSNWYEGERLRFQGEFYSHTLMTPMFTPTDTEHGPPRVFLAAVGPLMTEVAGEVADGLIVHPFTTQSYMRDTTLPAIERGLAAAGRDRSDFEIAYPGFIVSGQDEKTFEATKRAVKKQISFYGSTPAYRPVLESEGWGELQLELNRMSKQGQWDEMGLLITDEMLDAFAVVGEPADLARGVLDRYGEVVDRMSPNLRFLDEATQRDVIASLAAN
ncbi:MAG: TIGR03617 family F420-dependent LLM class oxidoreductase [Acidobacteria bacterium]|nr:TIGR03617 family F420-dependent LLM class oxidoreductase [Acidobacteriota bacterium]